MPPGTITDVALPDGTIRPLAPSSWGWGAWRVDTPPKGWTCASCGTDPNARLRKRENFTGRHVYADGTERCTPCAHAWWEGQGC
jgi:hypothetical protein